MSLKNILFRIKNSKLVKRGIIYGLINQLSNILAWLNYLLISRYLPIADIGNITFLNSIQNILVLPSSSISTSFSSFGAKLIGSNDKEGFEKLNSHLTNIAIKSGLFISIAMLCILIIGKEFFNIKIENFYIIIFSFSSFFIYWQAAQRGRLYANLRVDLSALTYLLEPLIKNILFVVLIYLGLFSQNQVLFTISLTSILIWLLTTFIPIVKKTKINLEIIFDNANKVNIFLINAFIAKVGLMILNSIDLVLIKHYFDPISAGIYSQILMMGNVLFFGAQAAFGFLLPVISHRQGEGKSGYREFFILTFLVMMIALFILIIFGIFPKEISIILLGNERGNLVYPYIFQYGIGMYFLSIAVCFNSYSISKNDFWPSRIYLIGAMILGLLLSQYHTSISEVVSLTSRILTLISILIIFYQTRKMIKNISVDYRPLTMMRLLIISMKDYIFISICRLSRWRIENTVPKNINDYMLLKTISKFGCNRVTAVYKDKNNNKYFVRLWLNSKIPYNDQNYYYLKNESIAHKFLFDNHNNNNFKLIKPIEIIEDNQYLAIFSEYIEDETTLRKSALKDKDSFIYLIIDYFKNKKLIDNKNNVYLAVNSCIQYVITLPFFALKAILTNPSQIKNIFYFSINFLQKCFFFHWSERFFNCIYRFING